MTKNKEKIVEGLNPYIKVVWGSYVFEGDYRLITPVMNEINKSIVPAMEKGTEYGIKNGLIPSSIREEEAIGGEFQ